ncbi:MAG: glycosyltransferase [Bacteroidota bacterium]
MKKILWQTRSPLVFDSFQSGKLLQGANGGNAYDFHAAMSLKEKFEIAIDEIALLKKKENTLKYWTRMKSHNPVSDIIIKEPYPMVFGSSTKKSKQVAMIHHIDDKFFAKDLRHRWFFKVMKNKLRKMDLVITVSKYWENYLSDLGCKKIKVIYNSFNASDYLVSSEDILKFKTKYGFNNSAPLIYIGNAHRPKGVYEVYEALRNSPYQLVMTGSKNNAADLPVKYLRLDLSDYLCLLNASDLVITLSNIPEGWNRIAHEALLSKTPVIGSGRGGMKELLQGAGQKIVTENSKLPSVVEEVLKNKNFYSEKGFQYVKKFDTIYSGNEWIKTISNLVHD